MRALIKRPGVAPQSFELPENEQPDEQLAAMQAAVGGYVETCLQGPGFVVWCNEEGKLIGLPPNFIRPTDGDVIVGSVLVTGALVPSLDGMVPTDLEDGARAFVVQLFARLS